MAVYVQSEVEVQKRCGVTETLRKAVGSAKSDVSASTYARAKIYQYFTSYKYSLQRESYCQSR